MFKIRNEQKEAFNRYMTKDFEMRVSSYLHKTYPVELADTPEAAVRDSIRVGITRAARYGITSEYDVVRFIDVMYLLSPDFDTRSEFSWAHHVLDDPTLPTAEKMDMIHQKATGYVRKIAGKENQADGKR